jgi:hypothetical protein
MGMFSDFPSTSIDATVAVAAEGRLHNCGWEGGRQSNTTHPVHLLVQQVW